MVSFRLTPHSIALLLILGLPTHAESQSPGQDSTGAHATVRDLPMTAAQRQVFFGSYAVTLPHGETGDTGRIFEENGSLRLQAGGEKGRSVRLLYQGEGVFVPEGIPDFVFTFALENGRATRFTVRRPDGVMVGVRIP
jgi:hypothetical protein